MAWCTNCGNAFHRLSAVLRLLMLLNNLLLFGDIKNKHNNNWRIELVQLPRTYSSFLRVEHHPPISLASLIYYLPL